MLLKTIAFIIILYLLVKFIGRLFLPSPGRGTGTGRSSNFRVFYRVFKNIREQQKRQQQQQKNSGNSKSRGGKNRFDEIEEAEFEEISEPKEKESDKE